MDRERCRESGLLHETHFVSSSALETSGVPPSLPILVPHPVIVPPDSEE